MVDWIAPILAALALGALTLCACRERRMREAMRAADEAQRAAEHERRILHAALVETIAFVRALNASAARTMRR